jgi:hypothetical protein
MLNHHTPVSSPSNSRIQTRQFTFRDSDTSVPSWSRHNNANQVEATHSTQHTRVPPLDKRRTAPWLGRSLCMTCVPDEPSCRPRHQSEQTCPLDSRRSWSRTQSCVQHEACDCVCSTVVANASRYERPRGDKIGDVRPDVIITIHEHRAANELHACFVPQGKSGNSNGLVPSQLPHIMASLSTAPLKSPTWRPLTVCPIVLRTEVQ